MRAAATAALCGIPAAVSPPTSPTSMTPAPPGTGTAPPIIEARVSTAMSVARLACCPTACSDAPRHSAMNSWLAVDPASTYTILRGCVAIAFRSVQMVTRCGRTFWLASRRMRGTSITTAASTTTPMTIQTTSLCPPPPAGTWKSPAAKPMDSKNTTVLATQLAVPAMAPELMAASMSYPWHWKNRTRTAKTATSPPTNDVNRLDISRAAHRPYGIGPITAPVTTQALLSTGIWASTNASATHPHFGALDDAQGSRRVAEHGQDGPQADQAAQHHRQVHPADPLRRHQLGDLHAHGCGERLP